AKNVEKRKKMQARVERVRRTLATTTEEDVGVLLSHTDAMIAELLRRGISVEQLGDTSESGLNALLAQHRNTVPVSDDKMVGDRDISQQELQSYISSAPNSHPTTTTQ